MRHYFGYDVEGRIRSVEVYGPTGWPHGKCMMDPNCEDPAVVSLRESRNKSQPEIIGWVLDDCCCDPSQGARVKDCRCNEETLSTKYVDVAAKVLKTKPLAQVMVDGAVVTTGSIVTRPPGTAVSLHVVSEGMPDETTIRCVQKGPVDITIEDEWDLTISGGKTESVPLVAPAPGTRGALQLFGKLMRPTTIFLRGFPV